MYSGVLPDSHPSDNFSFNFSILIYYLKISNNLFPFLSSIFIRFSAKLKSVKVVAGREECPVHLGRLELARKTSVEPL
jgi:hypothetical protein